jgi:SAM-dependent methyltransferase
MAISSLADPGLAEVYEGVERYYTDKILEYGPTPHGVDWESEAVQEVRFRELLKICEFNEGFSLNDVGCGYGALALYLTRHHPETEIDYLGFDLSAAMIDHAVERRLGRGRCAFAVARAAPRSADYSVASGIFNIKLDQPVDRWERFVAESLGDMRATSRLGFAVNFMGPHALGPAARPALYATLPGPWISYCEKLGSTVEVVADYGLREFTLLVRPEKSRRHER